MLKKSKRIPRSFIEELARRGRRIQGKFFEIRYLSAPSSGSAVSVSKKIMKTAVGRNRIRRRAYAALRHLPLTKAAHLFIAQKGIEKASYDQISADLGALVAKIRL